MDLSSILKTVISLADVVIKKPTTSVQNSGIDLSSIISMASIFMGGKNNNSSAGGLGSILGSALGSGSLGGMLGGMMGGGQQQQPQQQSGGGMGDVLGSVLGGMVASQMTKQQPQQQSGGGMGDVLGSVIGGMMGGGQKQPQQQAGGGMGDILGGVLGGMMGGGQQQTQQSGGGLGDLLGQLTSRAGTINHMLDTSNGQKLSADEKNNLTDVLNIINATKMFAGK